MDSTTKKTRKIIVTQALPYANASLHLGHILEAVQTDIWVRFQNINQNECLFFCADDTHGTPVMLKAKELGIEPEELIKNVQLDHIETYDLYDIKFTNFHSTHSDENKKYSEQIYLKAKDNGYISRKTINQLFDESESMFLSDRFVMGTCPKCGAEDQYGDNCSVCGATYDVSDIKHPMSAISNTKPIKKESEHLFFDLPKHIDTLKDFYDAVSIIDLIYLIITILSIITCFKKGFVLSILSMAKWLLAYVITLILFPRVKPYFENIIDNEYVLDVGLGITIFVIVIFLVLLVNKGISKAVSYTGIGGLDTTFGFFFGFIRAYIISVCIFSGIHIVYNYDKWPINVDQSYIFPYIEKGSNYLIKEFPNEKTYQNSKEKIEEL